MTAAENLSRFGERLTEIGAEFLMPSQSTRPDSNTTFIGCG
jgi:hypothetical protein